MSFTGRMYQTVRSTHSRKAWLICYVSYVRVGGNKQGMIFERGRIEGCFILWIRHYGDGDNSARFLTKDSQLTVSQCLTPHRMELTEASNVTPSSEQPYLLCQTAEWPNIRLGSVGTMTLPDANPASASSLHLRFSQHK